AAAHLAAGVPLESFGALVDDLVRLPDPLLAVELTHITGEVLHVDHFGTAVTSVGLLQWDDGAQLALAPRFGDGDTFDFPAQQVAIGIAGQTLRGIARTYADVSHGEPLALVGSGGYLELSINGGSFAEYFGVQIGDIVELQIG